MLHTRKVTNASNWTKGTFHKRKVTNANKWASQIENCKEKNKRQEKWGSWGLIPGRGAPATSALTKTAARFWLRYGNWRHAREL